MVGVMFYRMGRAGTALRARVTRMANAEGAEGAQV